MKILPLVLALATSMPWTLAAPVAAASGEEEQCRSALDAAENLMVNGRALWITNVRVYNVEGQYENYPHRSPVELTISMGGDAAPDMMSSPRLLTSITEMVMRGCPEVGLVDFAVAETDWVTSFGLIGNQVREFECIDPDGTNNPIRWGYRVCI